MNEETLNSLLALGFSYEDLYKRGLLVLKPAQDAQKDAQPAQDAQPTQDAQPEQDAQKDTQPAQDAQNNDFPQVKKMLDDFKAEIKGMIANANIQNATRTEDTDKDQMTVTAAIHGLYKGDK